MRHSALALLMAAMAASPAAAQNSTNWTLAEQSLEDGRRAIVLSRQQPRGRAEYRLLHEWRRTGGVYADDCMSESGSTESAVQAERLANARQLIAAQIGTGPCTLDPDVLDGFDPMFARLEEMARSTVLPDVQAWESAAAGYEIRRDAGIDIAITFEVADLHGSRVGEVEVQTYHLDCPDHEPFLRATAPTTGDLAARIAAARRATEEQVRAALTRCSFPHLSVERLMAGFDDAVALAEAELAADLSRR